MSNKIKYCKTSGEEWTNHLANNNVSTTEFRVILRLKNQVDKEILKKAFFLLIKEEPILNCSFEENDEAPIWVKNEEFTGLFEIVDNQKYKNFEKWFKEEKKVIDSAQTKMFLNEKYGKSTIFLALEHTCSDAVGLKYMIKRISDIYNYLYEGKEVNLKINERTDRTCKVVFDSLGIKDISSLLQHSQAKSHATWAFNLSESDSNNAFSNSTIKFDENIFNHIQANRKLYKATINDIFLTAFYRSMFRLNSVDLDKKMEVVVTSDLRKYLKEPEKYNFANLSGNIYLNLEKKEERFMTTLDRIQMQISDLKKDNAGIYNMAGNSLLGTMKYKEVKNFVKASSKITKEQNMASPKFSNFGNMANGKIVFGDTEVEELFINPLISFNPNSLFILYSYNNTISFSIGHLKEKQDNVDKLFKYMQEEIQLFIKETDDSQKTLTQVIMELKDNTERGIYMIKPDHDEFYSYNDIYLKANKLLGYFQKRGIAPGTNIIFQFEDKIEFFITFWACQLGGYIAVPLVISNSEEKRRSLFNIYQSFEKAYVISNKKCIDTIFDNNILKQDDVFLIDINDKEIEECTPKEIIYPKKDDTAIIQFSSGSTGSPKGVILTHKNIYINISSTEIRLWLNDNDRILGFMPMTHDFGIIIHHLLPCFMKINQYHMAIETFMKYPELWLEKCSEYKATITSAPNFAFRQVVLKLNQSEKKPNIDLSSVKMVINGAEPIDYNLCNKFLELLKDNNLTSNSISPCYGMAEATLGISTSLLDEDVKVLGLKRDQLKIGEKIIIENEENSIKFVSIGRPMPGIEVKIFDQNGNDLGEDVIGEIKLKAQTTTKGYCNNKEATDNLYDNGFLNTGDIGFLYKGEVYITGRIKDIIFINGHNYYPQDIENNIFEVHPYLMGNMVVSGVSIPGEGDEIVAFVVKGKLNQPINKVVSDIKDTSLAKVGVNIDKVVVIDHFTLTNSGKVKRFDLVNGLKSGAFKEIYEKGTKVENSIKKNINIEEGKYLEIAGKLKNILKNNGINIKDNDESFFDAGANSIIVSQVYKELVKEFSISIELMDLFNYKTLNELTKYIYGKDNIEILKPVNLPEIYIKKERVVADKNNITYSLKKDLSDNVKKYSVNNDISPYIIIKSAIALSIANITKSNTVPFYFKDDSNITEVSFDFDKVKNYKQIFSEIKKNSNKSINTNELEMMNISKMQNEVLILISTNKNFSDDINNKFDIVINHEVNENIIFNVFYEDYIYKKCIDNLINIVTKYLIVLMK